MARVLTYRAAWQLGQKRGASLDAVRTHGGYGCVAEYEVGRSLRDAVGAILYSGTSDIQRNVIERWLGL